MKLFKLLFVLICILATMWVFSLPAQGQDFQPRKVSDASAAMNTSLPFRAVVERNAPVFADRQVTEKIAEVKAGRQVTVLEISGPSRNGRPFTLLVAYTDKDGSERAGWFYGTLHVHAPR
ncbi:MAG: hypothetical protein A4E67_01827 [Syntrophaceae bacterium PtaB.Bin038]|nr:MAG: hypothetical protein A4E67_01827 [Syntrophaceae bacterium PtaB.Bin038]